MLPMATCAAVPQVLRTVLRIRRRDLEVWSERLREWFATRLLKPLVTAIDSAHTQVRAALGPLRGWFPRACCIAS